MKRLLSVWTLAVVCAAAAFAVDFAALKPQGYVSDFANVVDASSKQQLEQYCAMVERSTGVQMAFVTLPSLAGEPVDQVANDLFRRWGIGHKDKNDGVLLLLSIQDRRSRLEIGYGMEPEVTDGAAGDILRAMRPALRGGDYGGAFTEAATQLGARIAKARNVTLDTSAQPPLPRRHHRGGGIPFPVLLLGGIVVLFVLSAIFRGGGNYPRGGGGGTGFLAGMLLGNLMNGGRSWGGSSGGGFGGYDSGGGDSGGFGGFGGGDSGGGGASSDW